MREFVIITDNTCDMPMEYYKEHNVGIMSLNYIMDGQIYTVENSMPVGEFYNRLREGSMPTTSQANPAEVRQTLEAYCKQGKDVLYIVFSSALSGSYNNARIAAEGLNEDYPDTNVVVVDSLCASMGEGLLLYYAVSMKEEGKSLEEIRDWLEKYKLHICHNFTVDDLNHLYRGGRVSRTTAVLGTMIGVKPVLHMDDEGHLVSVGKARGRKKSITAVVDRMEKQIKGYEEQNKIIFISHGDCMEDAEYLRELVRKRFGTETFLVNHIGPTIGAHSGPGTLAVFFIGEYR